MKKAGVMAIFGLWFLLQGGTAYASVFDWPVLSQGSAVVTCIVTDAGKILTSVVSHLSAIAVETFQTVGQCLIYTTAKVTPLPDVPE